MEDIALAINQYGFPIIAAVGLGYFIYYIWNWVTQEVDPVVNESHMTLIGLIDRVRMLDNDLIRLNTKLKMILEQKEKETGDKRHAKTSFNYDDDADDDDGTGISIQ